MVMDPNPGRESVSAHLWAELVSLGEHGEEIDQNRAGDLIHILNERGERAVVDWALPLLTHAEPWRRAAAAWTLGQHGYTSGRPFTSDVMPALTAAARRETDDDTRELLVSAIGHADDPAWVEELLHYADDPHAPVRTTVAVSLPIMFAGDPMDERALDALIKLSSDPDPHVRDWATMGLGSQNELDSPAIRSALRARLDDTDEDDTATSGEAALGLAERHDPSVYPCLREWLSAPAADVGNLTVMAAAALGDARLLPSLHRLRDAGWQVTDPMAGVLDNAITTLETLSKYR